MATACTRASFACLVFDAALLLYSGPSLPGAGKPQPMHWGEVSGRARVSEVVRRETRVKEKMCIVIIS